MNDAKYLCLLGGLISSGIEEHTKGIGTFVPFLRLPPAENTIVSSGKS